METTGIIQRQFTIWNSNLSTYGAYQLVSWNGNNYSIVPNPFTEGGTQNGTAQYIPSGAGFFVQPVDTKTAGALVIREERRHLLRKHLLILSD